MYGDSKISNKFTMVGSYQLREPAWDFDLLGVWRANDGYYLGTDSGCSCPTPWESHSDESLTGPLTAEQAKEEATSLWKGSGSYEPERFEKFLAKIED